MLLILFNKSNLRLKLTYKSQESKVIRDDVLDNYF